MHIFRKNWAVRRKIAGHGKPNILCVFITKWGWLLDPRLFQRIYNVLAGERIYQYTHVFMGECIKNFIVRGIIHVYKSVFT